LFLEILKSDSHTENSPHFSDCGFTFFRVVLVLPVMVITITNLRFKILFGTDTHSVSCCLFIYHRKLRNRLYSLDKIKSMIFTTEVLPIML